MTQQIQFFQHPLYIANSQLYTDVSTLLTGERAALLSPTYLWPHATEEVERQCDMRDRQNAALDRKLRERRTQYVNYLLMARERFVSLVMRGGVTLGDDTQRLVSDRMRDIDGNGRSFSGFVRDIVSDYVSYGNAHILTDTQTVTARTRAEELESGVAPYWSRISPTALLDWQLASDGAYNAARYVYTALPERASLQQEPELLQYTQVLSLVDGAYTIQVYSAPIGRAGTNAAWTLVDEVSIPELDFVPLASTKQGESQLARAVPVALKIYNKQSDLDNILYNQGYDRVFVFADLIGALGADGQPLDDDVKALKISTNSMVVLPPGGQVSKLDPTNPAALIDSINNDVTDLFRVTFNVTRSMPVNSRGIESAATQHESKEELYTRIRDIREEVLDVVRTGLEHYAAFAGEAIEPEVSFETDISEADLAEISAFIQAHSDRIAQYGELQKAVDKKIVKKLGLPEEQELIEAIEATPATTAATQREGRAEEARNRLVSLVTERRNNNGRRE